MRRAGGGNGVMSPKKRLPPSPTGPINCGCYRTGPYCTAACLGPAHLAWYGKGEQVAVKNVIEMCRSESLMLRSASSSQPTEQPRTPLPPPQLKHFYAVQSLRAAVWDLWTSTALVDIIPEHAKMVVVDTRLPIHTLMRVLIEYKKAYLLLFCEESGQVKGVFNFHDIVDFLLHYHRWMTDQGYQARLCEALGDYAAVPDLLCSPDEITGCVPSLEAEPPTASSPVISPSVAPTIQTGQSGNTASSVVAETRCGVRNGSAVVPDAPVELLRDAIGSLGSVDSVRTSVSSKEASYVDFRRRSTGAGGGESSGKPSTLSRMETLAVLVTQQHQELLLPLPPWFAVKLFENPQMTLSAFRRLVSLTNERIGPRDTPRRGEVDPEFKRADAAAPSPAAEMRRLFLLPPPWLFSLTLWRKICGFNPHTGLLGIDPQRPPLEAALLITQKQSRQVAVTVWNPERQIPLNGVGAYSMLNHCLQHLRGDHPALNLSVLADLQLGVPHHEVVTVFPTDSLASVLVVMRTTRFSSLPVVSAENGAFLGFFNRTHLMAIVSRALQLSPIMRPHHIFSHDGGGPAPEVENEAAGPSVESMLSLESSLESLMLRFFNYNLTTPSFVLHTYGSTARFASDVVTASSEVGTMMQQQSPAGASPAAGSPPRRKPEGDTVPLEGRTVLNAPTYNRITGVDGPPTVALAHVLGSHGLGLHAASPAVLNAYVCSPAIVDSDVRLRDAVAHVLQVEAHRLVLIDPVTQRIRRLLTAGDLLAFLIGHCCGHAIL